MTAAAEIVKVLLQVAAEQDNAVPADSWDQRDHAMRCAEVNATMAVAEAINRLADSTVAIAVKIGEHK